MAEEIMSLRGMLQRNPHAHAYVRGNAEEPFAEVGKHYNPGSCPRPAHAGDLPPLFNNKGYAIQMLLTDRFTVEEIIGRTVILHSGPDDFTSQPVGNAGVKIACGVIYRGSKELW